MITKEKKNGEPREFGSLVNGIVWSDRSSIYRAYFIFILKKRRREREPPMNGSLREHVGLFGQTCWAMPFGFGLSSSPISS